MSGLARGTWRSRLAWAWLGMLLTAGLLAPYLPLPYLPATPDLANLSVVPFTGSAHWLGTDSQGQDVLANLLFGTRTLVLLTLPAAAFAALLGALLGGAAGFWGNRLRLALPYWLLLFGAGWWALQLPLVSWVMAGAIVAASGIALAAGLRQRVMPNCPVPLDSAVLGATAVLGAVPRLVLAVALASMGLTQANLLLLLLLLAWPDAARLVRAHMLRVRILPFIEAGQAAGIPAYRVWLHHAMRPAIYPLRVAFPLSLASLIGLETTLSFLGIGLPPTTASWGKIIGSMRQNLEAWWLATLPLTALIITILSLQIISQSIKKTAIKAN